MLELIKQLRHHRCLLILDNVEAVLSSSELVGTYRPGYEDYGWLFQQLGEGQHQSTILLTSREIPTEVAIQQGANVPIRLLRLGCLSIEEGETILKAKGLTFQAGQPQVRELIERYQGNPLALEIVAAPLLDLFDSNITAFLAQDSLLFKDIRGLLTSQFNRLSLLEQQVMYWLAINREAVTAAQLQTDLLPSISLVELQDALFSLDRRSLIEKIKPTEAKSTALMKLDMVSYTQQPVVMEYVIEQLIEQVCQEVEQAKINRLRTHALLKAQAKDYVRDAQMRLIVQPILAKLLEMQGGSENLKHLLLQLLRIQQNSARLQPGYFAGNAINLLLVLGVSLSHLDFSNLTIWQADLRMVNLHSTDFSHADLRYSVFTQSTTGVVCVAFSPDAKNIATRHDNGEVCIWQVEDGQQTIVFREIATWSTSIVFSPDSETLIISGADGVIKLLHLPSGTVRGELHGHTGTVFSLALNASGRLLDASRVLQQAINIYKQRGDNLGQAIAQTNLSVALEQLGEWKQATVAINTSLNLLGWNDANYVLKVNNPKSELIKVLAPTLDILAGQQLRQGNSDAAYETSKRAEKFWRQLGDNIGAERSRINQAQALRFSGFNRRAFEILELVYNELKLQKDSVVKVSALRSLGNVQQQLGELDKSKENLQHSLKIAQSLQLSQEISLTEFSLGNITFAFGNINDAIIHYQNAANTAPYVLIGNWL